MFKSWVGKIPWRREWLPTPVFLPGNFHEQNFGRLQSVSCKELGLTQWPHGLQRARLLCPPLSQSLLRFRFIELVMLSNHLILCCPFLLLPSIFPSIGVFSNESALCIKWPEYWSFSFSVSLSSEYSGLISFRTDSFWSPCYNQN